MTFKPKNIMVLLVTNNLEQQDLLVFKDFFNQLQQPQQFNFFTSCPSISLVHIIAPIEEYLANKHNLLTNFIGSDKQYHNAIDTLRAIELDLGIKPGSGHLRIGNFQQEIIMHAQELKPEFIYVASLHAAAIHSMINQQKLNCQVIDPQIKHSNNNPTTR